MTAGYGTDIWCTDALQPGRLATAEQVVAQALYRRFITPRGALISLEEGDEEDTSFGFDLSEYLGAVGSEVAVNALPAIVRAEALKDDRLQDVLAAVTATQSAQGEVALVVDLTCVLTDSGEQFRLTLGVDEADVTIFTGASA